MAASTRETFTMASLDMQCEGKAQETFWGAHAARVLLQLYASNQNDFALAWPVARTFHKAGAPIRSAKSLRRG